VRVHPCNKSNAPFCVAPSTHFRTLPLPTRGFASDWHVRSGMPFEWDRDRLTNQAAAACTTIEETPEVPVLMPCAH